MHTLSRSEECSREKEMHLVQVGASLCNVLERVGALADIMGVMGAGDVGQHLGGYCIGSTTWGSSRGLKLDAQCRSVLLLSRDLWSCDGCCLMDGWMDVCPGCGRVGIHNQKTKTGMAVCLSGMEVAGADKRRITDYGMAYIVGSVDIFSCHEYSLNVWLALPDPLNPRRNIRLTAESLWPCCRGCRQDVLRCSDVLRGEVRSI